LYNAFLLLFLLFDNETNGVIDEKIGVVFLILAPMTILSFFERKVIKGLLAILALIFFVSGIMGVYLPESQLTKECHRKDGRIRMDVCRKPYCELPSSDYGQKCSDDSECEKFCQIQNADIVKNIFQKNYSSLKCEQIFVEDEESCRYQKIKYDKWRKETGIEITGICSKYFHKDGGKLCSGLMTNGVSIQKGMLMVNDGSCVVGY